MLFRSRVWATRPGHFANTEFMKQVKRTIRREGEKPRFQYDCRKPPVYDINDIVSEYLVDYYNSNSRETYDITPVTTCDLSSDTGELFRMDDYPERFFKWADKFINIIC